MEASSPHWLGFTHNCSSLFLCLRCEMFANASPRTNSKSPLPPGSGVHLHLPPRFHFFHPKPNTQQPTFAPPPPSYQLCLSHPWKFRDSLNPPPHRRLPLTASKPPLYPHELSSTTVLVSVSMERPPPEPPPHGSLQTLNLKQAAAATPPLDPSPRRPPRKPPDAGKKSHLGRVAVKGACLGPFLFRIGFQISRGNGALLVYDEKPQQRRVFWKSLRCEGPCVAVNNVCLLSGCQLSFEQRFHMNNPETTYSRNVPAEAKNLIHIWIEKKRWILTSPSCLTGCGRC